MEALGVISILFLGLLLFILVYGLAVYNGLATRKARLLETVSNIGAYKMRRKRVNRDVARYSKIACRHERKAIKLASTRGR